MDSIDGFHNSYYLITTGRPKEVPENLKPYQAQQQEIRIENGCLIHVIIATTVSNHTLLESERGTRKGA